MHFIGRLIVTALATAAAVWLVPGISLTSPDLTTKVLTLLGVAVVFGLVNGVVAPLVKGLSTCLIVLTLGIALLVINALMLMLTSWLAGLVGLGFEVDGFWAAFFGAIVISIVGAILGGLLGSGQSKKRKRD